jgi:signal transduction histidine kinase
MLRSIRWRLVASYVLLTLLTVSLVGVLALSLIRRYVEQQELDYLTANAEAVASQALSLIQPVMRRAELRELAQTASFLGNVQVKILDSHRQALADSGNPTGMNELVWITSRMGPQPPGVSVATWIMVLPHVDPAPEIAIEEPWGVFEQLPPDAEFTMVRQVEGTWGNRFVFGTSHRSEVMPVLPTTETLPLRGVLEEHATLRSVRTIVTPIGEANEPVGYVELGRGPDLVTEALTTARRAFLLAAGGATLLAAIVGLLVSRGLTAPLRALTTAASQMSSSDMSIRAPVRGKDEIGQLARQFNQMAEQLEASFAELAAERDSLRRFIADASHELRTPITALKNFNELLQGAAADDPSARSEFLAESQTQLERLEWITHNLLNLSRLDAGLVDLDADDHHVDELIEATGSTFKTLAVERGISLSIERPSAPLYAHCDRARIELALSNLVDNALKFTPAGGEIEIGASQAGETVHLWVRDTGAGIDPADLPHIFERFYRGRNNGQESSGLGLAIVQSIVQAHGGRCFVESAPGSGSRFVIELPRSPTR